MKNLLLTALAMISLVINVCFGQAPEQLSMQFDGVDDYISVSDANLNNNLSDITVEAWIKPCFGNGTSFTVASKLWCGSSGDASFAFSFNNQGNMIFTFVKDGQCNTNNSRRAETTTGEITDGVWQHVAVTHDQTNGETRFYYNGNRIIQDSISTNGAFEPLSSSNQPVRVGVYYTYNQTFVSPFSGQMDEFRLWDHGRTDSEIQNNYDQVLSGTQNGLKIYFSMEDLIAGNGETVTNKVTTINDGITSNFANDKTQTTPFAMDVDFKICCPSSGTNDRILSDETTEIVEPAPLDSEILKVVPNPVKETATVSWNKEDDEFGQLYVISLNGEQQFKKRIKNGEKIDLSNLSGLYVVEIHTSKNHYRSKVTIH